MYIFTRKNAINRTRMTPTVVVTPIMVFFEVSVGAAAPEALEPTATAPPEPASVEAMLNVGTTRLARS